ncbi:MAG: iron-containing alcohol dehydrogenase, partial [Proteobacteria bacterium]|nr:iron-containing alcohol dehydrogenase [Pseudomonadota bacterium]
MPTHLSFGNGNVTGLGKRITELGLRGRAFVITDDTVGPVHGPEVMASLACAGFLAEIYAVPAGEASKSLDRATDLYAWLASHRAERRDVVVALGGGVVGDLAGFVAATFLRGITLV